MQRINKKYFLTVLCLIGVSFILGCLYYFLIPMDSKLKIMDIVSNLNNWHYNCILKDLIVMSLLLITSFFIIGIPLCILYLFYESFSLGFLSLSIIMLFKIKGFLFITMFLLLKLIPFIMIIIFLKKVLTIGRLKIGSLIYKREISLKERINHNFNNSLYIILFVFIINVFNYFISPLIFSLLK